MDEDDLPTVPDVTSWITTVFDISGAILVAVGLVFGLWPVIGGFALVAAGGFVWLFSAFVMWRALDRSARFTTRWAIAAAAWWTARSVARARRRELVETTQALPIVGS